MVGSLNMILEQIEKYGFFEYGPKFWGEYQEELNELIESKTIVSLASIYDDSMNSQYIYVLAGNPQNVHWEQIPLGKSTLWQPIKGDV